MPSMMMLLVPFSRKTKVLRIAKSTSSMWERFVDSASIHHWALLSVNLMVETQN